MKFIQTAVFVTSIGIIVALTSCNQGAEEGKRAIKENTANPFAPQTQAGPKPASTVKPDNQSE